MSLLDLICWLLFFFSGWGSLIKFVWLGFWAISFTTSFFIFFYCGKIHFWWMPMKNTYLLTAPPYHCPSGYMDMPSSSSILLTLNKLFTLVISGLPHLVSKPGKWSANAARPLLLSVSCLLTMCPSLAVARSVSTTCFLCLLQWAPPFHVLFFGWVLQCCLCW